jgi:hypothetical protein
LHPRLAHRARHRGDVPAVLAQERHQLVAALRLLGRQVGRGRRRGGRGPERLGQVRQIDRSARRQREGEQQRPLELADVQGPAMEEESARGRV